MIQVEHNDELSMVGVDAPLEPEIENVQCLSWQNEQYTS